MVNSYYLIDEIKQWIEDNNITDTLFMIYMSLAKISYLPLFEINQFSEE